MLTTLITLNKPINNNNIIVIIINDINNNYHNNNFDNVKDPHLILNTQPPIPSHIPTIPLTHQPLIPAIITPTQQYPLNTRPYKFLSPSPRHG